MFKLHMLWLWTTVVRMNAIGALCAVLALAVPGMAHALSLGSATGATVEFTNVEESSPTGDSPLYLAALTQAVGDSLVLVPSAVASASTNGAPDQTIGIVTFTVNALPGHELTSIGITEVGDWSLIGSGTQATSASIASTLQVVDVSPGASGPFVANAVITPGSPYLLAFDPAQGVFQSSVSIDLSGLGLTSIDVTYTTTLETASEAGTAALIQTKSFVAPVTSLPRQPIPEPGSLLLFAAGALIVGASLRVPRREN